MVGTRVKYLQKSPVVSFSRLKIVNLVDLIVRMQLFNEDLCSNHV